MLKTIIVLRTKSLYVVLAVLCLSLTGIAQENHLNKNVGLQIQNWNLGRVLTAIETQAGFFFSYDSELIPVDSVLSVKASNEKVKTVLQRVLPKHLEFKSVGNHVVIFRPQKKAPQEVLITGYIRDSRNNQPLANATLYDPKGNQMTASNTQGYYEMTVFGDDQKLGLTVSKSGYRQEVVYVQPLEKSNLDFTLLTLEKPITGVEPKKLDYPDVNERKIVQLMVPERVIENSNNLTLFERVPVQFSVIPGISTNGLLNANSTNNISLNLLAGYSQGTDGIEIGSLVNINRTDMNGLQIAGVANVTGRFMRGVQMAGMFNYTGLLFDGFQLAGMGNISMGDMTGAQLSGFCNILKGKMDGAQLSGFANFTTENVDGMQLAGFINIAAKDVEVAQLSGCINYSRNIEGMQLAGLLNVATNRVSSSQISGFANYAKSSNGGQISGYVNLATELNSGVQLSPFINYARQNDGIQFGMFNYADTSSGGISIGLLSIEKKGLHAIDISTSENLITSVSFRSGNYRFYNIFGVGFSEQFVMPTYGIGTAPSLGKKLRLNLDLTASGLFEYENTEWGQERYYFQFFTGLNYQPFKKFGVVLGPTLNFFGTTKRGEVPITRLSSYDFHHAGGMDYFKQLWIGGKLSVRLF